MDTSKFHGPLYFVYPLLGIIMPILACITVISNTIIIVVLSRQRYLHHHPHPHLERLDGGDKFDKAIVISERGAAPRSVSSTNACQKINPHQSENVEK